MTFKTITETPIYKGPAFDVKKQTIKAPNGATFNRDIVHSAPAVVVVAVIDGKLLFVHQYRAPINRNLLELPAGKCDKSDENVYEVAERELIEETGYRANHYGLLGSFYSTPGICTENILVVLVTDLVKVEADPQGIEEHHMQVVLKDVDEVYDHLDRLKDAKTLAALTFARPHIFKKYGKICNWLTVLHAPGKTDDGIVASPDWLVHGEYPYEGLINVKINTPPEEREYGWQTIHPIYRIGNEYWSSTKRYDITVCESCFKVLRGYSNSEDVFLDEKMKIKGEVLEKWMSHGLLFGLCENCYDAT